LILRRPRISSVSGRPPRRCLCGRFLFGHYRRIGVLVPSAGARSAPACGGVTSSLQAAVFIPPAFFSDVESSLPPDSKGTPCNQELLPFLFLCSLFLGPPLTELQFLHRLIFFSRQALLFGSFLPSPRQATRVFLDVSRFLLSLRTQTLPIFLTPFQPVRFSVGSRLAVVFGFFYPPRSFFPSRPW